MAALAFLTIAAVTEHARSGLPGLIPLTRNEIAHLAAVLPIRPAPAAGYWLRWSAWRRQHQHHARSCRYQRQTADGP